MKQLTSAQIRQMYLDFFAEKQHQIIPSASLIPVNDPTLLWINAGVAPLKKYFDGTEVPDNRRLANVQKCIRTNDIENVGYTARHHTLFEMLGNWSIGDYFKKEVIAWAWEFLTSERWLGFEADKLFATYYPDDKETPEIWKQQPGFISDHLVAVADNFWDIGAGPCGPDTEIFYDRGQDFNNLEADDPENYPGGENERWLEIWNLVFSEFNHLPDDTYQPLPNKNVDTGMGLERVVSVIQNAKTNYETDLFVPIIQAIEKVSGVDFASAGDKQVSFKVIADHIRSLAFAIGDGALPGNEGRGYVLRRLLRRAVMHGRRLGISDAFLYKLVPTVGQIMESYYPEVLEKKDFIEKIVKREEETFARTIDAGSSMLDELLANLKKSGKDTLEGKDIFKLYDTYGFPVELTEELAEDEGFKIDHEGFKAAMKEQQERARASVVKGGSMGMQNETLANITEPSEFLYEAETAESRLSVIVADDARHDSVNSGQALLVFEQTPFYAEMGGQVADHGTISDAAGTVVARVVDVQRAPNGQALHTVEVEGELVVGANYKLEIDHTRRHRVMKNHTATHLLHAALHNIVGDHAVQAGSLNEQEFLRFDFTHFEAVTPEELRAIEEQVNEEIWKATPVTTIETDIDTAKSMGAMALFGEKYGKNVRVVSIGDYSVELCGGTHVANTAEIGMFKIVKEEGIGSGTRRILAVTSREAYLAYREEEDALKAIAATLKAPQLKEVPNKVASLQEQLHALQKENAALKEKAAAAAAGDVFKDVKEANGVRYIASQVEVSDAGALRTFADQWKQADYSDVLVLAAHIGEKVNVLVASKSKDVHAGNVIKVLAPIVSGRGGGKPDMAMAGGSDANGIQDLLSAVAEQL